MSNDLVKPLVQQTLRDPQAAAARIIGLGLGRETLWTGLALVAALNTFVVLLALQISPPAMAMPGYFDQPLVLFFLLAGDILVRYRVRRVFSQPATEVRAPAETQP